MSIRLLAAAALLLSMGHVPSARGGDMPGISPGADVRSNRVGDTADELLQRLLREIDAAPCTGDGQCHTVPIGAKPCGGPEAYLAWSEMVSDARAVSTLAARHRAAREAANANSALQSNCAFVPDPGALCVPSSKPGLRVCRLAAKGASAAR